MKKLIFIAAISLAAAYANAEEQQAGSTQAAPASFSQIDSNQDGMISKEEAQSFAALEISFDSADTNQDGSLDAAEFAETQTSQEAQ